MINRHWLALGGSIDYGIVHINYVLTWTANQSGLMTFDHLTLKVVSKSRVTWATSVPISVFLGLSVLELRPTYATDSHQTSEKASLRHRFLRDQTFLLKEITSFLLLRFSLNVNINNQNSIACRWLHHGLCSLCFQGTGIHKVSSWKVFSATSNAAPLCE